MATINRQSVRIINHLLSISGIIRPNFAEDCSNFFIGLAKLLWNLLIIGTTISSFAVYVYLHRHNPSEYCFGVPHIGNGCSLLVTFVTFISMRNELKHLLRRLDQNIYTYSQEDQIQADYPWFYRESSTRIICVLVFSYVYSGIIPCIFPLIDHFLLKQSSMSFPLWMPWNEKEHFWPTYVVQVTLAVGICWLISISQLFVLFGVIEFSRQNMRLCVALSSIQQRCEMTVVEKMKRNECTTTDQQERYHRNLFDNEFQIQLKQCIQHHQQVVELFQIFKYWFTALFSSELLADSFSIALEFYNFFQTHNSWVVYSALVGSSFVFITILFTRCFVGEIFSNMNEKISKAIFYEVRWYEQSISNKRLLSIFHSQARRPMDLHAFTIFKASFFTFASLIRKSYSYLNILKASFSSKD